MATSRQARRGTKKPPWTKPKGGFWENKIL